MYRWTEERQQVGRVGKGISAQASHRTVLETLASEIFSFSVRRILHIIELNSIIPKFHCVVFLSTNERAEPFAPSPLQKLHHYYGSVRHSSTHRLPEDTLNPD